MQNVIKNSQEVKIADDTTVISSGKLSDPLASQNLLNVTEWFSFCKPTINVEKCEAMSFVPKIPHTVKLLKS